MTIIHLHSLQTARAIGGRRSLPAGSRIYQSREIHATRPIPTLYGTTFPTLAQLIQHPTSNRQPPHRSTIVVLQGASLDICTILWPPHIPREIIAHCSVDQYGFYPVIALQHFPPHTCALHQSSYDLIVNRLSSVSFFSWANSGSIENLLSGLYEKRRFPISRPSPYVP